MSAMDRRPRFRRILLALDATSEDEGALDVAARLAARLEAELTSLLVEDIDMVRLAELPGAYAFSTLSARRQSLDAGLVERALKVQLAATRRAVEAAARRRNVSASFAVRRGRLQAEVVSQAATADLVIIGFSSGGFSVHRASPERPGRVARAVAAEAAPSVLVLHPGAPAGGPVVVAYDGTAEAQAAVEAALEVAGQEGSIEVVLMGDTLDEVEPWRQRVADQLAAHGIRPLFLHMPRAGLGALCLTARQRRASLMVLGAASPLLEGGIAERMATEIGCSVLLVR